MSSIDIGVRIITSIFYSEKLNDSNYRPKKRYKMTSSLIKGITNLTYKIGYAIEARINSMDTVYTSRQIAQRRRLRDATNWTLGSKTEADRTERCRLLARNRWSVRQTDRVR